MDTNVDHLDRPQTNIVCDVVGGIASTAFVAAVPIFIIMRVEDVSLLTVLWGALIFSGMAFGFLVLILIVGGVIDHFDPRDESDDWENDDLKGDEPHGGTKKSPKSPF